jgi:hypothetical protein
MHYCKTVQSVFLHDSEHPTSVGSSAGFSRPSMTFAQATKFSCVWMHNECTPSWIMVTSESLMLECAVYYFLLGIVHWTSDQSLCPLFTAVKQQVGGTARHMDCFSSFSVFLMFTHQSQPPTTLSWYKNLVGELYMQWALFCNSASFIQCIRATNCCVNWTIAHTHSLTFLWSKGTILRSKLTIIIFLNCMLSTVK